MIFDAQTLFSDAQPITGDVASTNIIDLGEPGTPMHAAGPITQDIGRGRSIPMRVQVVQDFNTLTNLAVNVQVDTVEGFGSPRTVASYTALLADLKAGFVFPINYVPLGTNERFVRLQYDVTGSNPTTGKITAGLVFGNMAWSA